MRSDVRTNDKPKMTNPRLARGVAAPRVGEAGGETGSSARLARSLYGISYEYYRRLFSEYIAAKRQLGDPVDHITPGAFEAKIRASEQEMAQKHGRPVRYQVQLRGNAVVLNAVPLP